MNRKMVDPLIGAANYSAWTIQMEMALLKDDLWEIVSGRETEPVDNPEAIARFKVRSKDALTCIILNIEPGQLYLVGRHTNPKTAWDKVKGLFYKSSWNRRLVLKDKLSSLRMKEGDDLKTHLKELTILLDQLEAAEAPVSQEDRVTHLLTRVSPEYKLVTEILKNQATLPEYDEVVEKLLAAETHRTKELGESSNHKEEDALAARQSRGPRCFQCGRMGHIRRDCMERSSGARNSSERREISDRKSGSRYTRR